MKKNVIYLIALICLVILTAFATPPSVVINKDVDYSKYLSMLEEIAKDERSLGSTHIIDTSYYLVDELDSRGG